MRFRWLIFWVTIALYLMGTIALVYISVVSEPPSSSSTMIEATKTLFLCLGGLGIILPVYISATNEIEERHYKKLENTFRLIERWDDPHLFSARKLTRKIASQRSSISDDHLVKLIDNDEELKQSVHLVANYFENVRFSIQTSRIDAALFRSSLGDLIIDIINRFEPYFKTKDDQVMADLLILKELLKKPC